MAYNEIFSVSSHVSLIQPENRKSVDFQSPQYNSSDAQSDDLKAIRFSPLSFSSFYSSLVSSAGNQSSRHHDNLNSGCTVAVTGDNSHVVAEDGIRSNSQKDGDNTHQEPPVDGSSLGFRPQPPFPVVTDMDRTLEQAPGPLNCGLCYCRRDLLAVKLFYFSFIGAIGIIFPYLSVFLKQIGLSAFQIGIISGIRPVLGFISAPIWGSMADRFKIRRTLMIFSLIAWMAFFVGLYFLNVPARLRTPYPDQPTLHRNPVRFRRAVQQPIDNNETLIGIDTGNRTGIDYRLNTTDCNYSGISSDDQELLKENLSWIYEPADVYLRFVVCILIICGGEIFQSPTTALTDAATLQVLGRENLHQYGAQRAWGPIGWAISSLAVGALLSANRWTESVCGIELTFSDYRLLAYVFMCIMVFGIIAGLNIDFGVSKAEGQGSGGKSVAENLHSTVAVMKMFMNVHYGSWILTTFVVGLLNGIIWGFLFWHLDNLGGSQLLMGIDSVVMCVCEFISFFFVDHVIRLVGHMGIMYIGLFGYSIRFIVYASITNPWLVIPADVLQGVTFSFIWVSLTAYTAISVPCASLATIQGIVHGVYFGLGNGLGHFIGGVLIGYYGAVITFYSSGIASALWLVFFFLCQKFSKKPSSIQFAYQDLSKPDATNTSEDTT